MKRNTLNCLLTILLITIFLVHSYGQFKPRLLRFEEDYSTLTDSLKKKYLLLRFKNIALNNAQNIRVSVGLDYREMYELVKSFDSVRVSDGFWTTRLMIHSSVQFGNRFRTFIQLGRGVITERQLPIRPVDQDQLFMLNGFAEYRFGTNRRSYLRVGRQELFFGMGRLIAPREGPNIRNTYDGARVHYSVKSISSDAFFSYLVTNKPGIFDNKALGNNQRLWGLYNSWKNKNITLDMYYLGYYNPSAFYSKQPQRDREKRHTIGVRVAGNMNSMVNYDAEMMYQFGSFGKNSIQAFLGDAKISGSYSRSKSLFKTTAKITWSSGNRSIAGDQLGTFNPLFPNLLYYQTAIGIFPANIINPQLMQEWKYKRLTVAGGVDLFWRQVATDGLYAPFGYLDPGSGTDKYLGHQLYTKIDLDVTQNLVFTVLASRYYKSKFIGRNPDARGVDLLLGILMNYKL